jgi:hypothetical protein
MSIHKFEVWNQICKYIYYIIVVDNILTWFYDDHGGYEWKFKLKIYLFLYYRLYIYIKIKKNKKRIKYFNKKKNIKHTTDTNK